MFKYNFVKKIMHRGRLLNVTESTASNKQDLQFPCVKCKKSFKRKLCGCTKSSVIKPHQTTLKSRFHSVTSPLKKDAEDSGDIAKSAVEHLVTKVVQNEKEIVDVVKKERSSYDFEFKLKVINHSQAPGDRVLFLILNSQVPGDRVLGKMLIF